MNKHTPGPWVTNDRYKTSVNAGKKHIAMVNQFKIGDVESDVWGEEHEANAQLIAAAPELLEALEELLSEFDTQMRSFEDQPCQDKARSAIIKATQPITKE